MGTVENVNKNGKVDPPHQDCAFPAHGCCHSAGLIQCSDGLCFPPSVFRSFLSSTFFFSCSLNTLDQKTYPTIMFCLLMWKRTSSLNAPIIWQQDPTFFSEMYPCSYFVIWDSTSRCLALPKPFGGQCCDSVSACGSELGMSFSPWGHLTMSGDISGCYSYRECYYHLACRGQRCCLGSYSGQDSHLQRGII